MNNKKNIPALAGGVVCIVLLTLLDQITKTIAVNKLSQEPYVLIDGVFEFHYIQNYGSAWKNNSFDYRNVDYDDVNYLRIYTDA